MEQEDKVKSHQIMSLLKNNSEGSTWGFLVLWDFLVLILVNVLLHKIFRAMHTEPLFLAVNSEMFFICYLSWPFLGVASLGFQNILYIYLLWNIPISYNVFPNIMRISVFIDLAHNVHSGVY